MERRDVYGGCTGGAQCRAARGGDDDRGLRARAGGRWLWQDAGAHAPLCLPRRGARHPAGQHPLRDVHQQGGNGDAQPHPRADRRQRHGLHQHISRLLRLHPAGGQPCRRLPEELPRARQRRHRRHAREDLRGARPDPARHDVRPGARYVRDAQARAAARLLQGAHRSAARRAQGEVRPGAVEAGYPLLRLLI